ncbi:MAG: hypothetical protein FWD44_01850 [Oscillospiraceae bacterium]|nr:hypothetical protein [Oscillospiraceae bacterium]
MLTIILCATSKETDISRYDRLKKDGDVLIAAYEDNDSMVKQCCDIARNSDLASDILILSENIILHDNLIDNMKRALYAGDRHAIVYGREIDDRKSLIKTAKKYLPEYSISLSVSAKCVLIKRSVVNMLGFLDEAFSELHYALLDFYCRINRYGFSSIMANHALYSHDDCAEHIQSSSDKELFLSRHINREKTVEQHILNETHPCVEFLELLDDEYYPKKRILFDFIMMPPQHCGTSEYQLSIFEAFYRLYSSKYDIYIYTTYEADEYHKMSSKYDNIFYPDTITGVFHLGYTANQIMFYEQQVTINKLCLKTIQTMHDIMMLRIDNHFPFNVHNNVELGVRLGDGIVFCSNYSKNDFLSFFANKCNLINLQLEVIYYTTGFKPPIKNDYELPFSEYFLIVGNEYKHKAIKEAIDVVSGIDDNFIVIGYGDNEYIAPHVYSYKSGHIDEDFLSFLYANCKAVILPSLYEGFGFPIVMSLKSNKRVIVNNSPLNHELQSFFHQFSEYFLFFERFEQIGEIINNVDASPKPAAVEYDDTWDRVATELEAFFDRIINADVDVDRLYGRRQQIKMIEEKRLAVEDRMIVEVGALNKVRDEEVTRLNEVHREEASRLQNQIDSLGEDNRNLSGELLSLHTQFNDYKLFSLLRFSVKENVKNRHKRLFGLLKGGK